MSRKARVKVSNTEEKHSETDGLIDVINTLNGRGGKRRERGERRGRGLMDETRRGRRR